jgi:single-strand DNA-binding protein
MPGRNDVTLCGHLAEDVSVRTTTTGKSVTTMRMATNEKYIDKDGAEADRTAWHNVVAWGKLADACGAHLRKGSEIAVFGRLQTRSWDAQDGSKRYTTEVIADVIAWSLYDKALASYGEQAEDAQVEQGTEDDLPF